MKIRFKTAITLDTFTHNEMPDSIAQLNPKNTLSFGYGRIVDSIAEYSGTIPKRSSYPEGSTGNIQYVNAWISIKASLPNGITHSKAQGLVNAGLAEIIDFSKLTNDITIGKPVTSISLK